MWDSEYDFYKQTLEDEELLSLAVDVPIGEDGDYSALAVPVGGKRKGGYISIGDPADVPSTFAFLSEIASMYKRPGSSDGFPNLRTIPSPHPEVCDVVEWGEPRPNLPGRDASGAEWAANCIREGRFYGYAESQIEAHVRKFYSREDVEKAMTLLEADSA